ncbi:MAG: biotin carboxylase N-terminal domain-containing protein [Anaerolineae bacterium]
MFKKVLIANRGEIALRIQQTCREMGIATIALYEAGDSDSLHVRFADECVQIDSGFSDEEAVLRIARERGADAIHPGYGFLAERPAFARACAGAGITLIAPPHAVMEAVMDKPAAIARVREAGFPTVQTSTSVCQDNTPEELAEAVRVLGYPLLIKSCRAGRGPGTRLVRSAQALQRTLERAQAEAFATYGSRQMYFERAIVPAHQVGVQVLRDHQGRMLHFGAREGSLIERNRRLIEEAPTPCMDVNQQQKMLQTALYITRLFDFQGLGTVEFVVDGAGNFFFAEIKPRIQTEHPLLEMLTGVDLVRQQLRTAAGEPLELMQEAVIPRGHAIMCRINAEDPRQASLPSPGQIKRMRMPSGACVRVDTHIHEGYAVSAAYNPLIAKVTVWGADRARALERMRRALYDFDISGVMTNLAYLQDILRIEAFVEGCYDTETELSAPPEEAASDDLAAIAAVLYLVRSGWSKPTIPERLQSKWHLRRVMD